MAVKWTKEQQKVIDTRNRNLLVSAAAGSGKTAVLVERIIQLISDNKNQINIDNLLVVTFTNAAASEMRERINDALEKKLLEHPENEHIHRQIALLPYSSITTIHSFCLKVIRGYFHLVDIDPSFRVGDETELTLLRRDVLTEVFENEYKKEDEDFLNLIESFSSNKSDEQLMKLVLKIYTFAMSYPWPEKWLKNQVDNFDITSEEELQSIDWIKNIVDYIGDLTKGLLEQLYYAKELCLTSEIFEKYQVTVESDIEQLEKICTNDNFYDLYNIFKELKLGSLKAIRNKDVDVDTKEEIKNTRNEVKKSIEKIKDTFFFESPEVMTEDIKSMQPIIKALSKIVLKFMRAYAQSKKERNIVDFNDLEHIALEILLEVDEETGKESYTSIAKELQQQYDEILIDEYQDSNMVQEKLLTSVSKVASDEPNIFMVGCRFNKDTERVANVKPFVGWTTVTVKHLFYLMSVSMLSRLFIR